MQRTLVLLALTLLALVSCLPAEADNGGEIRVLFIGNSLTYWNDLPAIIQAIAHEAEEIQLKVETVAYPNYSLEDHWKRGDALRAIRKGKWDYVVLQQGPSASSEARSLLLRFAQTFADEIRAEGSEPVLFSVWPARIRKGDFERSIESYTLTAGKVDGILIPVGRAWLAAWESDPNLELYAPDGLHPSQIGSYLAALVFYEALFSKSSSEAPSKLKLSSKKLTFIEIESTIATVLHQAAIQASNQLTR